MGFIEQAKSGVVWTFLQQFSVQIINFGVQIVLARLLMPSDFGLVAMIAIFIAVGQMLSDSGMTSSLIRNKKNTEDDYGTVFMTNLFVSIGIYIVIFICAPFVGSFYNQDILTSLLRVYALVYIFSSFSAIQVAKFSKELNFRVQFTYQLPSVVVGAAVGVLMAYYDYGVWSLVGLNIAQSFSFSLFLLFFYKWRPKWVVKPALFKHHFQFGYKLTLSGLIDTIYLNLYKVVIGKYFSVNSVGYFSQADNLRLFPITQLSNILSKVTYPLFASIGDDDQKLKRAYMSSVRLVLSISSVLMLILVLIATPLFSMVFGEKWLPSVPYFQILCFASIFLPFSKYNLTILKVKGRSDLFLQVEVIKKVIGVSTLLICLPFGIEAIVWGLCLTNILFAYINGYYSGKLIDYPVIDQVRHTLGIVALAFVPFLFTYLLNEYISEILTNRLLFILINGVVYLILYLPLVFLFNKELVKDLVLILKK